MKKSFRIALASVVLLTFAPLPLFASVTGGDPVPQVWSLSVLVSVLLSVLGL